jgi:hypothetical protein
MQIFFLPEHRIPRTGAGKYRRSELVAVTGAQAVDLDAMRAIVWSGQTDSCSACTKPDQALYGLRFILSVWVVQRHVGQVDNTWHAVRNTSITMTGFMLLGGFMLSASVSQPLARRDRINLYVSRLGASLPVYWFSLVLSIASFLCYCRPNQCVFDADAHKSPQIWWGKFLSSLLLFGTGFGFPIALLVGFVFNGPLWFSSAYNTLLLLFPYIDAASRRLATASWPCTWLVLTGTTLTCFAPFSFMIPSTEWYFTNRFTFIGWICTFSLGSITFRIFAMFAHARATHPKRTRLVWSVVTDCLSLIMVAVILLAVHVSFDSGIVFGDMRMCTFVVVLWIYGACDSMRCAGLNAC